MNGRRETREALPRSFIRSRARFHQHLKDLHLP
jgi:hypothetical protein